MCFTPKKARASAARCVARAANTHTFEEKDDQGHLRRKRAHVVADVLRVRNGHGCAYTDQNLGFVCPLCPRGATAALSARKQAKHCDRPNVRRALQAAHQECPRMVANAHVGLWDLTSPLLICVRYLNPPQARTHGRENVHGHTTPESVQLSPRPRGAVNRMCDRTHSEKQGGARRGGTGKQKGRGKGIAREAAGQAARPALPRHRSCLESRRGGRAGRR